MSPPAAPADPVDPVDPAAPVAAMPPLIVCGREMPAPLRIFSDFIAFELLSREKMSAAAHNDVCRRRDGFLARHPSLLGAGFLVQPQSAPGHHLNFTVFDASVRSSFGSFGEGERAFLSGVANQVFSVVKTIMVRWNQDFPQERLGVTFHEDRYIMTARPNSVSGVGFRALQIQPEESPADEQAV